MTRGLRIAALLLLGCSKKEAAVPAAPTVPAPRVVPPAAPAQPPAPPLPPPVAASSADGFSKDVAACKPKQPGESNVELKGQAFEEVECLRKKLNARLDEVLLPLKTTDAAAFLALMHEQADFNRFVGGRCALEEEVQWLDLEAGTRSDGSMRSLTLLGCQHQLYVQRLELAHLLIAHDDAALVSWLDATQGSAQPAVAAMSALRVKAKAFAAKPPSVPEGFQAGDWAGLLKLLDVTDAALMGYSRGLCSHAALKGTADCEAKVAARLLSHAFEPNGN